MESFFAYSEATAKNQHQFPRQLTDIHDRMFSIQAITQRYRVFVIILDSMNHYEFILTYLDSFITSSSYKTFTYDVRFLILCPGSKRQSLFHLQNHTITKNNNVYWIVSVPLAKQLQVYCTYDSYHGPFLLEVHENGYWQLVRHIDPEQEEPMDWLTWSLLARRQECEQRAQLSVKTSHAILQHLVKQQQLNNDHDDHHHHRRRRGRTTTTTTTTTTTWGWSVCPLEIKYAILNQIHSMDDIMQCAHAVDPSSSSMRQVIMAWLIQRLECHRRPLLKEEAMHQLPVKTLVSHEQQLSWLVFQLQSYTKREEEEDQDE